MSSLAVLTGLDPRVVADLDEDDFDSLTRAVEKRERSASWTNTNEQLAAVVEALWMLIARLDAGIATVSVHTTKKPKDLGTYPRPEWVRVLKAKAESRAAQDESGVVVVTKVGDALRMMKKGASRGS